MGRGSSVCDLSVPFCGSPLFFHAPLVSNRGGSKILADVDAVFVLSEARRVHQDNCGKTVQFTAPTDKNSDGMWLGYLAGLTDSAR